ncbi:Panacea domain-containing protein [Desulfovibrio piger]|uniref:Panacea domain-containing protein n=1 Tax=Desulfovibrio piger TaxID=901 RepID=UPI0026F12822|nr:type II toxin-antitoxin system antitoxin SocA domain-containing protein [Desulfovibrio piger]
MEKALAVANAIIKIANDAKKPPTQMKLQKLLYFAHGWFLALYGKPLLDETFQAWKYGPVVPSVYHEFKDYGVLPIENEGKSLSIISDPSGIHFGWEAPKLKDVLTVQPFLKKIWDVFGKFTGNQLSAMTHEPDTPWTLARSGKPEDEKNIEISNEAISRYFCLLKEKSNAK